MRQRTVVRGDQRIMRCYMWRVPIPWPKRERFRKFCRDLNRFTRDLPKECRGCRFAQVYEPLIGAPLGLFEIHFEFQSYAQLDAATASAGMRRLHEELQEFLDPSLPPQSYIFQRVV